MRGENIPIRMYLAPYDMTPTYRAVHNKFSVRYSLNLVLVDQASLLTSAPPPPPFSARTQGTPWPTLKHTQTGAAQGPRDLVYLDVFRIICAIT